MTLGNPYGIVYLARCKTSGKGYVGQTVKTLAIRWKGHIRHQGCRLMNNAIKKYGAEAFELSILAQALDQDSLNRLEAHWIKELGTLAPGGYNLTEGGGQLGKPSPEALRRMKEASKGRTFSSLARESAKRANTGRKHSPEENERNRQANLGRAKTKEEIERIRRTLTGRPVPDERRANMSKTALIRNAERRSAGRYNYNAKLTEDLVREVLLRRNALGEQASDIARSLGISVHATRGVLRGDSWAHVKSEHRTPQVKIIHGNTGRRRCPQEM